MPLRQGLRLLLTQRYGNWVLTDRYPQRLPYVPIQRARTPPLHKFGTQDVLVNWRVRHVNDANQVIHTFCTQALEVLAHGGKRRLEERGFRDIVKADD